MAELEKTRNTDVPASIAGYYYQILLACREISRYDEVQEVGVETGADVNVICKSKDVINIEAKFHEDNFGKYAEDIVKTIYNFYTEYDTNIKKFTFSTNVNPSRTCKDFFDNWGTNGDEEDYVKKCILKKSIEGPCKAKYKDFCDNVEIKKRAEDEQKKYIDILIEETLDGDGKFLYKDYAIVRCDITYSEFVGLIHFSFAGKKKYDLISEIRKDIKINIEKTIDKCGMDKLDEEEYDLVINKMIDCFLDKISLNSQNGTNVRVTSAEYLQILQNCHVIEEKHISKYKIFSCIEYIQEEEENVVEDIRNRAPVLERETLETNYKCVQEMIFGKIADPNGYDAFVRTYQLKAKASDNIAGILIKIVYCLSIVMTKEKMEIEDIELIFENRISNIRLRKVLECSYKRSFSSAYRTMQDIVGELISKYQGEANIDENQIVIIDAEYKRDARPCECVRLEPEVYDITQADANYEDYLLFCNMNYKCTECLDVDDTCGYKRFMNGGGNLCKKI